jgi:hypothetical protein
MKETNNLPLKNCNVFVDVESENDKKGLTEKIQDCLKGLGANV